MTSQSLRNQFKSFFTGLRSCPHLWVPGSTLIPDKDPSLLFVNAGMNQFKDCFLGLQPPPAPQVCSIQKCLRAGGKHNDLEEVGFSPFHHTFFEMMGNFSFGSYDKGQAIHYAVEFLTRCLGIPKNHLWITVFKEDKEAARIWRGYFPKEKIIPLGEEDNFWRMGPTGPCGPCSEIHHYTGPKTSPSPRDMTEIWNLVFMEYNETPQGPVPLPRLCIDTGVGLERLTTVLQGKTSNYDSDVFSGILQTLQAATGLKYSSQPCKDKKDIHRQTAFQVTADHSRALSFLIHDGVLPGSEGASYVLRRILRRALFYSHKLTSPRQNLSPEELLCQAVDKMAEELDPFHPGLKDSLPLIKQTVRGEAALFRGSLKQGESVLLKHFHNRQDPAVLDPERVWDLYSTYGFPPDLTRLIAREQGFQVTECSLEELKKRFVSKKAPPPAHKKASGPPSALSLKHLIEDPEVIQTVHSHIQSQKPPRPS